MFCFIFLVFICYQWNPCILDECRQIIDMIVSRSNHVPFYRLHPSLSGTREMSSCLWRAIVPLFCSPKPSSVPLISCLHEFQFACYLLLSSHYYLLLEKGNPWLDCSPDELAHHTAALYQSLFLFVAQAKLVNIGDYDLYWETKSYKLKLLRKLKSWHGIRTSIGHIFISLIY